MDVHSEVELKNRFLDTLARFKKAMDYADSSVTDKWKWQPEFTKILAEVSELKYQLRQAGYIMSDEEIHQLIENL